MQIRRKLRDKSAPNCWCFVRASHEGCAKSLPIRKSISDNFMQIPLFQCLLLKISEFGQHLWGRAKGAAKGSCGETVVQKGVFGESVFFSAPLRFSGPFMCFKSKP